MSVLQIRERKKEVLVQVMLGLSVVTACYMLMVHPVFQQIDILKQNISDSERKIKLSASIKQQTEDIEKMEGAFASLTERSMVLGKIADLANKNKIDVQTLTPKTQPVGNYIKLDIELDGRSTFSGLYRFLQEVEKAKPSLNVRDLSVLRQRMEGKTREKRNLQIHMVLETFLNQKKKKENA